MENEITSAYLSEDDLAEERGDRRIRNASVVLWILAFLAAVWAVATWAAGGIPA